MTTRVRGREARLEEGRRFGVTIAEAAVRRGSSEYKHVGRCVLSGRGGGQVIRVLMSCL